MATSVLQRAAVEAWIQGYRAACPTAPVELVRPGHPPVDAVRRGEVELAAVELPPAGDPGPAAACRPVSIPVLAVPVAVVHSLPGLPPLTVTPTLLARVFGGQVTEWNDPEMALVNPGVELPARRILVVRPAGPAAGAETLSRFLTALVPELWTVGPGSPWPAATAGRAAADVLADVRRSPGALGVVDTPARFGRGVAAASVDGGAGEVAPTAAAVRAAVAAGDLDGAPPDIRLTVDPALDRPGAYPLVLVGHQVGCLAADDPRADSVEAFLAYVTGPAGQSVLERLGYAALAGERAGEVRAATAVVSED